MPKFLLMSVVASDSTTAHQGILHEYNGQYERHGRQGYGPQPGHEHCVRYVKYRMSQCAIMEGIARAPQHMRYRVSPHVHVYGLSALHIYSPLIFLQLVWACFQG